MNFDSNSESLQFSWQADEEVQAQQLFFQNEALCDPFSHWYRQESEITGRFCVFVPLLIMFYKIIYLPPKTFPIWHFIFPR